MKGCFDRTGAVSMLLKIPDLQLYDVMPLVSTRTEDCVISRWKGVVQLCVGEMYHAMTGRLQMYEMGRWA